MASSFPTNRVMFWLFWPFSCQSQRNWERFKDPEKPHRERPSGEYGSQLLFDGKRAHGSFKVPLPASDKPTAFTVSTTEDTLRETKQNPHFPLLTASWSPFRSSSTVFTKARVHMNVIEEASAKCFKIQKLNVWLIMPWLQDKGLI